MLDWKKERYFFYQKCFCICDINKTCILGKFRNNRPVPLLGHKNMLPFIITYGSLICPFLVQVYKVVRVRVVVVVVDKCHLETYCFFLQTSDLVIKNCKKYQIFINFQLYMGLWNKYFISFDEFNSIYFTNYKTETLPFKKIYITSQNMWLS